MIYRESVFQKVNHMLTSDLLDPLQNLAERIGLASRYYIKSKNSSESLLPDDNVNDLVKESLVNLLHLNPVEVSTQLMVEDFTIFCQIEAAEYVDDLYELSQSSRYGNVFHFELQCVVCTNSSDSYLLHWSAFTGIS